MNAIQLAGVTKVDSGETVLNSVSLSIPIGAFWVITGSGSSVSAMLSLVSGTARPDLGAALLFGRPAHRVCNKPAFMRSDSFAFEHATLRANVQAYALRCRVPHPVSASTEAMDVAGVDFRDKRVFECGILERRLGHLALALVDKPRILLIDEPCRGLVSADAGEFMSVVRDVSREMGLTLVCGTKSPDSLRCLADSYAAFDGPSLRGIVKGSQLSEAGGESHMVRTTNLAKDFAALSERLPASTLSIELDADEGRRSWVVCFMSWGRSSLSSGTRGVRSPRCLISKYASRGEGVGNVLFDCGCILFLGLLLGMPHLRAAAQWRC